MFNGEVDDLETLHDANSRFYRAVEDLDLPAMESLWQHDGWVRCIHPGWDALIGWEQVRASFERIFSHTTWMRITPTVVEAVVFGDLGVVACAENITARNDGEVGVAVAQATNLFARTADGWRMIHHHASPAPVHVTQRFSGTVQ